MARNNTTQTGTGEISSSSSATNISRSLVCEDEGRIAVEGRISSPAASTTNEKEKAWVSESSVIEPVSERRIKVSGPRRRWLHDLTGIRNFLGRASNFVHEWTPFLLVATYFTTSIFAYMLFPAKLTEVFWFIYNFTNFIIAASTALEAFMSLAPNREARKAAKQASEKGWKFPTPDELLPIIDLVIVAYLPNEKDIIVNRIHYAVSSPFYVSRYAPKINIITNL